MRALLALAICSAALPGLEEEHRWSGEIAIVHEVLLPEAEEAERQLNQELIAGWTQRIARARERLPIARPEEKVLLFEDIAALERAVDEARRRRGGRIEVERFRYLCADAPLLHNAILSSQVRMVIGDDDGYSLVDRGEGFIRTRRDVGGPRESQRLAERPPDFDGAQEPGEAIRDHEVRISQVDFRGGRAKVWWAPQLPNVYALALSEEEVERRGIPFALARFPGLPLIVQWRVGEAQHRLRVADLTAREVDVDAAVDRLKASQD